MLREWSLINLAAPSFKITTTGDSSDFFPFSVQPDKLLTLKDVQAFLRNYLEGTEFDTTEDPAWLVDGKKSPLARPDGPPELNKLIGVPQKRAVGSKTSAYVFAVHLRDDLPEQIGSVLWFAHGPAPASVFQPIYIGTNDVPDAYDMPVDFKHIDRTKNTWNFHLVHNLSYLKWQEAIEDIKAVYEPAEEAFFAMQPEFEQTALDIFNKEGASAAEKFITENNFYWMQQVYRTYNELVDFLLYKYVWAYPDIAPPKVPKVFAPSMPKF